MVGFGRVWVSMEAGAGDGSGSSGSEPEPESLTPPFGHGGGGRGNRAAGWNGSVVGGNLDKEIKVGGAGKRLNVREGSQAPPVKCPAASCANHHLIALNDF